MDQESKQPTVFDSDQQQLGEVYAKALLGLGQQQGNVDLLMSELDGVTDAILELPKFRAALESPRIAVEEKQQLVDKAFGGKLQPALLNFLKVVAAKGRFDCLGSIRAAAHRLHDEMVGRVNATLTTAHPVDDSVRQRLESRLSEVLGKEVGLSAEINEGILGGMVVRVGDTVYDGSVQNQLNQVRVNAIKRASDSIRQSLDRFMVG